MDTLGAPGYVKNIYTCRKKVPNIIHANPVAVFSLCLSVALLLSNQSVTITDTGVVNKQNWFIGSFHFCANKTLKKTRKLKIQDDTCTKFVLVRIL